MLVFTRISEGQLLETEYEDFELEYVCSIMEESFYNGYSINQGIIDEVNNRLYVMTVDAIITKDYPNYEVILAEEI